MDLNEHWNDIFSNTIDPKLGWYEKDVSQTLKFLDKIDIKSTSNIFIPGAGTSLLADKLLQKGCKLILNDISEKSLNNLKKRIGDNEKLTWLHHDISKPFLKDIPKVDIWIDRAVLHFLLKEEDIQGYFNNLHSVINKDAYVLLAEFSTNGSPKCAGLELHRYSIEQMSKRMGNGFELIKHENYTFINPFGDTRPYIYALYKKI